MRSAGFGSLLAPTAAEFVRIHQGIPWQPNPRIRQSWGPTHRGGKIDEPVQECTVDSRNIGPHYCGSWIIECQTPGVLGQGSRKAGLREVSRIWGGVRVLERTAVRVRSRLVVARTAVRYRCLSATGGDRRTGGEHRMGSLFRAEGQRKLCGDRFPMRVVEKDDGEKTIAAELPTAFIHSGGANGTPAAMTSRTGR